MEGKNANLSRKALDLEASFDVKENEMGDLRTVMHNLLQHVISNYNETTKSSQTVIKKGE